MPSNSDITLIKDAFHRPDEPRHFMTTTRDGAHARVTAGEVVIADSTNVAVVREVGYAIYEPAVYFPREDVAMASLVKTEKSTFCPLKGNTEYFDLVLDGGRIADVAWSYVDAIDGLPVVNMVAFDTTKVAVSR